METRRDLPEILKSARPGCRRVVIVGGGAGGLELACRLARGRRCRASVEVLLVDRSPTHLWKPLLHELASGTLEPGAHLLDYAALARRHGFVFVQGEMAGLQRSARLLALGALIDDEGVETMPARTLHYDTLVLAVGSRSHDFGVPGAARHAIALDTPNDAERFRRRLLAACMRTTAPDEAPSSRAAQGAALLTTVRASGGVDIVIVGGGATGVELAAELRGATRTFAAYGLHRLQPQRDITITIVEAGPRILGPLTPALAERTVHKLEALGIGIVTGDAVAAIHADKVTTQSGKVLPATLVVWAAGIRAPDVLRTLDGLETNGAGQLVALPTLRTVSDPDIFAFGDCAAVPWCGRQGILPPKAQVAHQQAAFLADALCRHLDGLPLPEFGYREHGTLVSLGGGAVLGQVQGPLFGSVMLRGLSARLVYVLLYRQHQVTLLGVWRTLAQWAGQWLWSRAQPRVKLH